MTLVLEVDSATYCPLSNSHLILGFLSTDDSELGKVLSGFSPLGRISYFFQINSDFIQLPIQPILTREERKEEEAKVKIQSKLLASGAAKI